MPGVHAGTAEPTTSCWGIRCTSERYLFHPFAAAVSPGAVIPRGLRGGAHPPPLQRCYPGGDEPVVGTGGPQRLNQLDELLRRRDVTEHSGHARSHDVRRELTGWHVVNE